MRTRVIDDPLAWVSVSQSVCHLRGGAACTKASERIEVLFEVQTLGDPRHIVLDGVLTPGGEGRGFDAAFLKLFWPCYIIIMYL